MDRSKTFLIVGLGLLGGKYAQVLSGKGYRVLGIDRDPAAVSYARAHDYIVEGAAENFAPLIEQADYVIFGLYPTALLAWVEPYAQFLRPGALVTDVSGRQARRCGPGAAGDARGRRVHRQPPDGRAGVQRHRPQRGSRLRPRQLHHHPPPPPTPRRRSNGAGDLARTLGFARISVLSPAEHDRMIGYVSQLCHAIAVCLMCASDNTELARYTGDSFRDLTRIARINDKMWAELFLWNKDNLIGEIDMYSRSAASLREKLAAGDREGWRKCSACLPAAARRLTQNRLQTARRKPQCPAKKDKN